MKILICDNGQFGYNDYYYYVKYLSKAHHVDYFCLDAGRGRIKYVGNKLQIYKRHCSIVGCVKQISEMLKFVRECNPDIVLVRYFRYAILLGMLSKRKLILDIRTVDVSSAKHKRLSNNLLIRTTALFYQYRFTIKAEIAERLNIKSNISIVPLGAEIRQGLKPNFIHDLRLLYVGTLDNRRIHETIEGLSQFCREHQDIDVNYTIIGDGKKRYMDLLVNQINIAPRNLTVNYIGYVPTTELDPYYQFHNIGVSYVPIIDAYMPQPVTKTYEYLLAGMIVIGTALPFHSNVLTKDNGVIINDNPESFAEAIFNIHKNLASYNLKNIQTNALQYSWERVVNNMLIPALEKAHHLANR